MRYFNQAIRTLIVLTIITGIIYPLFIYALGNILFKTQAQGSIIYNSQGEAIGSKLIGQSFTDQKYFWPRPSSTSNYPYNAMSSGGSNLGPLNPALIDNFKQYLRRFPATNNVPIPLDLVTASASGLDPEISLNAAYFQVNRIAKARHLKPALINNLINNQAVYPNLGFLGEARVNVLELNLALNQLNRSNHD